MFIVHQDPFVRDRYTIGLTNEAYDLLRPQSGFYSVMPARVLEMNYAHYLIWAMNTYDGYVDLFKTFPILFFKDKESAQKLAIALNKVAKEFDWVREEDK